MMTGETKGWDFATIIKLRAEELSATQCERDPERPEHTECSCTLYIMLYLKKKCYSVLEGNNFLQMHMERGIAIP